jgi:hypothetical protein
MPYPKPPIELITITHSSVEKQNLKERLRQSLLADLYKYKMKLYSESPSLIGTLFKPTHTKKAKKLALALLIDLLENRKRSFSFSEIDLHMLKDGRLGKLYGQLEKEGYSIADFMTNSKRAR